MNLITTWETNRTAISSGKLPDDEFLRLCQKQKDIATEVSLGGYSTDNMLQIASDILCDNQAEIGPDGLLCVASQLVHMARTRCG